MTKLAFYRCPHCGNAIVKTGDSGVVVFFCGQPMKLLEPKTAEE